MLKSLKRIAYQVEDLEKAKQWYSNILNTQPAFDSPFAVIFIVGDCSLSLAKGKNPLPENTERIDVYWEVDDIDAVFAKFIENGAVSHTPIKAALNIRVAKVIDPFGNIIGLTGPVAEINKRTVEEQPSETAMSVAFCRALAFKEDREEIKGPDYLAESFLKDEAKKILADANSRNWAIQNLVTSPLYGYFISRTAFFDSIFESALKENIPQIVFLGAGYDTRSYRFADKIKETKIFELDIRPTQQYKIEKLKNTGVKISDAVSFVEINFKTDKLEDVLSKAGFNKNKKTLFIWEGVMYYLTEEAIDTVLTFIKNNSANGSYLCFDYMTEKLESVNAAEPFRFWIAKDKIEEFLPERGYKIITHMDSNEMEKKFLTSKDSSLAEKALTRFCFIQAAVSK
jgi:methyltransferase (TIGR00027 family)